MNIKKYRELCGISQAEAARRLGISRQAYNNYELGKREADYETLLKLAEIFNTSVESLLRDTVPEPEMTNEHLELMHLFDTLDDDITNNYFYSTTKKLAKKYSIFDTNMTRNMTQKKRPPEGERSYYYNCSSRSPEKIWSSYSTVIFIDFFCGFCGSSLGKPFRPFALMIAG